MYQVQVSYNHIMYYYSIISIICVHVVTLSCYVEVLVTSYDEKYRNIDENYINQNLEWSFDAPVKIANLKVL